MRRINAFQALDGQLHLNERDCLVADLAHHLNKLTFDAPTALASALAASLPTLWPILTVLNEPRNHVRASGLTVEARAEHMEPVEGAASYGAPIGDIDTRHIGDFLPADAPLTDDKGLPLQSLDPAELRAGQAVLVNFPGEQFPTELIIELMIADDEGVNTHADLRSEDASIKATVEVEHIERVTSQPEDRMSLADAQIALDELPIDALDPPSMKRRILLNRRIDRLTNEGNEA